MRIAVVGLGRIGRPFVAVLASCGHDVVGIDINAEGVRRLMSLTAHELEPDAGALLTAGRERIRATEFAELTDTEVTFVIVPTPSDAAGAYSTHHLLTAIESVGHVLRTKDAFHIVAVVSTVMPGTMDTSVRPALERASGKRSGESVGLAYCPEFVALGCAVRDLRTGSMAVIGESDPQTGDRLEQVLRSFNDGATIMRTNFINAELAKIAFNAFATTKISFANMLAGLCERIPGADAHVVTQVVGCDRRIGQSFFQAALSYGGPCLPRDNPAFARFAASVDYPDDLARVTEEVNRRRCAEVRDLVLARTPPGGRVAVLGLAYRPNTDVIEQSPAIALVVSLAEAGADVCAYDPAAMPRAAQVLGARVALVPTAAAAVRGSDVIVLATAWDEFRELTPEGVREARGRPTIIDCWRLLDVPRWRACADVVQLGVGPSPA